MQRIILLILVLLSPSAQAAEIAGVKFNELYKDHGTLMNLQGTGLKSMFFIKAFAAGFYKGAGHDADLLGNFPKRIEVEYFVKIPGQKLNAFTLDTMKDNVSAEELESINDQIQEMGRYFVDLKPGDRFSLTYIPNVGTKFEHNERLVGIVRGIDFARALFSVWLGEKPFDTNLKKQVLGSNRAPSNQGQNDEAILRAS